MIAWDRSDELRFGRLRLDQSLRVNGGPRRRIDSINSGYVQRGLSRYTSDWGRSIAPQREEEGLLIRAGVVQLRLDQERCSRACDSPQGTGGGPRRQVCPGWLGTGGLPPVESV